MVSPLGLSHFSPFFGEPFLVSPKNNLPTPLRGSPRICRPPPAFSGPKGVGIKQPLGGHQHICLVLLARNQSTYGNSIRENPTVLGETPPLKQHNQPLHRACASCAARPDAEAAVTLSQGRSQALGASGNQAGGSLGGK